MKNNSLKFAFFGTPEFAVGILNELEKRGFLPSLVISAPDKPRGRKLIITPPETKVWATERNIPVLQPEKVGDLKFEIENLKFDAFVVAAYGKIIPKKILDIPRLGTLNVHPSLLPRLRGASPLQSAILLEDKTGTTIMMVDEEMDHGDILAQEELKDISWPPRIDVLETVIQKQGGEMLADVLEKIAMGEIKAIPQEHEKATFTKKIEKEDGQIDPEGDPEINYRKFCAFLHWPRTYFFQNEKRVIITEAELADGKFIIKKVLPEGRKEMSYEEFLKR